MIEMLLKLLGLAVLGFASFQDIRSEMFSVYPVILALTPALTRVETPMVLVLATVICVTGYLQGYIRLGDALPVLLYVASYPSLQSIFTLTLVTGLYIAAYKEAYPEKEWIPYLPAILTAYIVHFIAYLVF